MHEAKDSLWGLSLLKQLLETISHLCRLNLYSNVRSAFYLMTI